MAFKTKLKIDPIRSLAAGSIGATYTAVGSAIQDLGRIVFFKNLTDADMFFSLDGIDDNIILPPHGHQSIDITANKVRDDGYFLGEGVIIYVKQVSVAATLGAIYIEVIHA